MSVRGEREEAANKAGDASESEAEDVFYDAQYPPEEEAELLDKSDTEKAVANRLFGSGRYSEAVLSYDRALSFVPTYLNYEAAVLKSNIAACHLKLEDWKAAVEAATASLDRLDKLEGKPMKAEPDEGKSKDEATQRAEGATQESSKLNSDESGVIELPDDADETTLARIEAEDKRKEDVKRIRAKSLMRRARAKMELGTWANLEGATEDYNQLLQLGNLPPPDERLVKRNLKELPAKIAAARENEMGEMMGKLKDLGNGILKPFGLSTDNFKFVKDENTGGYSMSFER